MIITDQRNQTAHLYEIQVTVIYSCAILVTVTECRAKRVNYKTWTETFANSAGPDKTPQNAASDQGLRCMFTLKEIKGQMKQS